MTSHTDHTKTLENPLEEIPRGTIFAGRYEIIEELGHGGMGKVYKVFDKETGSPVALKLIKPEFAADRTAIERFRNELKVARDISHKNICRMYDLGREADNYFITMEYVPGEDLKSFIRRAKRLDIGTAVSVAKQVGEGLAEAHRAGVVHRDLKPSNIMIDREGDAKIMDFGIARSLRTKGITGPGVVIGTPEYMSPEQVDGKEADPRADLYALSVILYEMVTGTVPFEGETAFAVGLKHKSELPENPKKLNPQIPDDLSRLILKGLEKDREKRYQSASEIISELTRIEEKLPAAEKAVHKRKGAGAREIPVKFRLRRLALPAVAVAAVAIGVVLWVLLHSRQPSKQPAPPSHRQLTFAGDAAFPAISPDGKFIAYMTGEYRKGLKAWVQDMASGRSIEVFSADFCSDLRWTPDGSELAFAGQQDSRSVIYLIPRLGGPPRQIDGFDFFAWSPEGSQLAGGRFGSTPKIYIVNKSTGKSASFNLSAPILFLLDVDWSPSGGRLLVLTRNKENVYSILTAKTDGGQQNTVMEDNRPLLSPRWSSHGDAIFYLRLESSGQTTELWRLPISRDTGKPAKAGSIVLSGIPMASFSLSADGKYFLYTRVSQSSNLWLVRIEGPDKGRTVSTRQLTSGTAWHGVPAISPDGKRIAFSRGSGETANIYVMPVEGGDSTQLTFLKSRNSSPAWSPDGTEIAFGSNEGGAYRVWKVNAQGGRLYQFAKTELSESQHVVWAPNASIMYQKSGNRNYQILNPKTEEETPLIKDESVGWLFKPIYSPDGKNVAVFWNRTPQSGVWIISLEDRSERFIGKGLPFGWSPDGKWVYTYEEKEGKTESLMTEIQSGKTEPLPIIPFTLEGKTYFRTIDDKPDFIVDIKTQSDVWVIEGFDRLVK